MVALNVISRPAFGPPYTHPTVPLRAHFVGATTPRSTPSLYLDAVRDLVDVWRVDVQHTYVDDSEGDGSDERVSDAIPLVVNTMGWAKGLGADLTQKIEEMVEPGQVFEFQTEDPTFSTSLNPTSLSNNAHHATRIHILEPAPPSILSTNYAPADHRTISILSYFHTIFPSLPLPPKDANLNNFVQTTAQLWNTDLPLCAIPPYEVDVHTAFDQIILVGAGSEDVVPQELSRVLNGALVGFVKLDHQRTISFPQDDGVRSGPLYVQGQAPPTPSESSCVGLGLIRAVSPDTSTSSPSQSSPVILHILTPVPPLQLSGARILVKGEMELPVWGMLDFDSTINDTAELGGVAGVERGKVPYLQWGRVSEGAIGGERRRVRRNLMRRGQS